MEGTHRLPDDAAPSFYADDNELLWLVEVVPAPGNDTLSGETTNQPELEEGAVW